MVNEQKMEKLYQAFYTKSETIVNYMIERLCVKPELSVLEPAAGDGVFIKALLNICSHLRIEAYELNPTAIQTLTSKFGNIPNVHITQNDTLTDPHLALYADFGGRYDRIIANPPYGAWQDYNKRALLKKMYKGLYVKETYTLFLYRAIQLLNNKGILVFIIPDTYLNLHRHTQFRQFLLRNTKILEIALFPSSFFPGVNFGYSALSIISLEKCVDKEECLSNNFRVLTDFPSVRALDGARAIYSFSQRQIFDNLDSALFISNDSRFTSLINTSTMRISDIADCVTGIYSGNDKKFIYVLNSDVKKASQYQLVKREQIATVENTQLPPLEGMKGKAHFVPIVKGGRVKYIKPDFWFLDWSVEAVSHYKVDKRARFQNSRFYFQFGIGVPMVSSSQITAVLFENKLFDQSIVGIFPKQQKYIYYLLGFFNSPTCNKLIRTINPSANNPANYIKKIPFIMPTDNQLCTVNTTIKKIVADISHHGSCDESDEKSIHKIFEQIYGLT
jgi:phospholipid N-methyltransferase